jgi:cytochrome c peroxidase
MIRPTSRLLLFCLLVLSGLLALACDKPTSIYTAKGKIVEVREGAVVVDHEDIPGYMPAMQMEMPLAGAAADQAAKEPLEAGQSIEFELATSSSDARIIAYSVSGDAPEDADTSGGTGAWAGWSFTSQPSGLPAPPEIPDDNPMSATKIALGHELFMDKRLSFDGSRSCYSCHQNALGNADGRVTALGAGDKPLGRNTPTIWNVAYHETLYWDGRAASLEAQAIGAWRGGNMGVGKDALAAKAAEIGALPEYRPRFEELFELSADQPVEPLQVAEAISAYERTLLCGDTAYDRGDHSETARRGEALFGGKAACITCHTPPTFSDGLYHVVGVGGDSDPGRGKVSGEDGDAYRFRTPTLRNAANSAPYFHNGSAASLEEAVRIMAGGGVSGGPTVDALLVDRGLVDEEISSLVAFVESLACEGELEVLGDQHVSGIPE